MKPGTTQNYIICSFKGHLSDCINEAPVEIEIYFAEKKDIIHIYQRLEEYFSDDDMLRANSLHIREERDTFMLCHTMLRIILSLKSGIRHSEIRIRRDTNEKPCLQGDNIYFNISHTSEAFAIAISENVRVGIDIEDVNRKIDYQSIIGKYFSGGEKEYILEQPGRSHERFFLLWTRKEALLKALGVGLIEDLKSVEVHEKDNCITSDMLSENLDKNYLCDHYIYSRKFNNYYISIAAPYESDLFFQRLDNHLVSDILARIKFI